MRKWAHNAAFERTCLAAWLGAPMPAEQWWDDMVLCAVCGLPMSLGEAGAALGMPEDKAKDRAGKALVRWFSQPHKATKKRPGGRHMPADYLEKWEQYREYNRQDVVAERAIHNMLRRWIPGKTEHRAWVVDQGINDRGIRVNLDLVRNAVAFDARYKAQLTEQAIAVSGLENPNSVTQIKAWLLEQEGLEVPSLNKKVVADVVAQLQTDRARQFMGIRKELSKSSTAKYSAMVRSVCADDHVRGCFQFCGAGRTGRWAGRRVQLQNLAKNKMEDIGTCRELVRTGDYETLELLYGNVTGCLSELVRTALIPEEGHRFIVCDYSAIEARVLAWISGEEWALEEFRGAGQIYEATGAMMFHVPKETIAKGGCNHDKRQAAKTAVLACGYGGSVNALKAFGADKMGMTEEDMVETVDLWRRPTRAPASCGGSWSGPPSAAWCMADGAVPAGNIRFDFEQGILWMTLPSGTADRLLRGPVRGQQVGRRPPGAQLHGYRPRQAQVVPAGDLGREADGESGPGDGPGLPAGRDAGPHRRGVPDPRPHPRRGGDLRTPGWADAGGGGRHHGPGAPVGPRLPLRGDGYYCDYYIKD